MKDFTEFLGALIPDDERKWLDGCADAAKNYVKELINVADKHNKDVKETLNLSADIIGDFNVMVQNNMVELKKETLNEKAATDAGSAYNELCVDFIRKLYDFADVHGIPKELILLNVAENFADLLLRVTERGIENIVFEV